MSKGTLPPHLLQLWVSLGKLVAPRTIQAAPDESTEWGVMAAVVAGSPALYNVFIGGSSTATPNLAALDSYRSGSPAPAMNDRVLLRRAGTDYVILGRVTA